MTAVDADVTERLGTVVAGKWKLERVLGVGGMAAVYAASCSDGSQAALKFLHPEMSRRRDVRERFLREAYAANSLSHSGAVRVLEHGGGSDGAEAYLVMELLSGEPLDACVKRRGGLPMPELLDYLDQVLDVLVMAHEKGIIHRDLKPDNLFVTTSGRIKILDFGLARLHDSVPSDFKTRTGLALGTLPYMAPEQALGKRAEIDGRADLFSLGATAFRILSGKKIHQADSEAELLLAMASKAAPPLASVAPELPAPVCAVIDLALAFSRDARYPDARTMQADVRAVRAGEPPPYASRRTAAREQATQLNLPAAVANGALAAFAAAAPAPSAPAPSARFAAVPASHRSVPPTLHELPATPAVPTAPSVSAGSGRTQMPAAKNEQQLLLWLAVAFVGLLGLIAAWMLLGGTSASDTVTVQSSENEEPPPAEEDDASSAVERRSPALSSESEPRVPETSTQKPIRRVEGRGRKKPRGKRDD